MGYKLHPMFFKWIYPFSIIKQNGQPISGNDSLGVVVKTQRKT